MAEAGSATPNAKKQKMTDPIAMDSKATPDVDRKKRAIFFLIHIHEAYMSMFKAQERDHIWYVAEITSIVQMVHVRETQEANRTGRMVHRIGPLGSTTLKDVQVQYVDLVARFKTLLKVYNLEYSKSAEGMANMGIVNAYLAWHTVFNLRFSEVRFGNNAITLTEGTGRIEGGDKLLDEDRRQIQNMGYQPYHSNFFGGWNYNPRIQRSIKQSLGPLTVLYNMVKPGDEKYKKTWFDTASHMFGRIDGAQSMLHAYKSSRGTNIGLNQAIANLVMLGVCRVSNKAALPFSLLLNSAYNLHNAYKQRFNNTTVSNEKIDDATIPDFIKTIDLSDKGLWKFYNMAATIPYRMYKTGTDNQRIYPIITFYAIFNLHRDDLAVFEFMTGLKAINRTDVESHLTGHTDKTQSVEFKLPMAKYGVKLASDSQIHLVEGSSSLKMSLAQESGPVTKRVEIPEHLFKDLKESDGLSDLGASVDIARVTADVTALVAKLKKDNIVNNVIHRGTSKFYSLGMDANGVVLGPEVPDVIEANGKYFFGPKL